MMSGPTANISTTTTSGTNNAAANSNNTNNGSNGGGSTSPIVSLSIRSEIHRFESVHPSIYNIYELLDHVADPVLAQTIREHVVNIEDCFVNSQEWTLSRSTQSLHVGLLGSQMSPKSTLVHRYLTNQYVQDNSPEGGRFKKEILVSNTPYLLLLRDEGGPPTDQFSHWTDALILVASSTQTTNTCFSYITRFANYRSLNEIPIVLVSVEENVVGSNNGSTPTAPPSASSLEFIKEFKKIPHSGYFHCNVRTGMNVELMFVEVCNMIVNKKVLMPPPLSTTAITTNHLLPHPTTHLQRSNSSLSDKNSGSTPISTPTTSRKFRRRSNLFKSATQDLGSGRTIPIKQGYLLKKSNNSNSKITNKKWKKKYVTISEGKLEYFDHINQYMDKNSGKQVELKHVTVKLTRNNAHSVKTITDSLSTLSLKKQSSSYNVPPEEAYGFQLVSISKQWDFETSSKTERDEWVLLIEEQIVKSLQANVSDRVSSRRKDEGVSEEEVGVVKSANNTCADCNAVLCKGGYWASLNLCVVVCIACSGVHRNLGTHLSKIRSMELDEMSTLLISPLKSIESNTQANRIYEANLPVNVKPNGSLNCSQEERSSYIRRKYESLEFLPESHVTQDMVIKSIIDKDFWRFLLYVNLLRKGGSSNAFWSDGSILSVAVSNDFIAAAQIILWMTNDQQHHHPHQPPTVPLQANHLQSSLSSSTVIGSAGTPKQIPQQQQQQNHVFAGITSNSGSSSTTTAAAASSSTNKYNNKGPPPPPPTNNAQYYSSSSTGPESLPCGIISSSNRLNIAANSVGGSSSSAANNTNSSSNNSSSSSSSTTTTTAATTTTNRLLNNNNNSNNSTSNNKKIVI